jgi:hypothetical protein
MSNQAGLAQRSRYQTEDNDQLCELERIVQDEMAGRVRAFQVVRCDEGLVLKGRTRTYYAKQMAQHLVMRSSNEPIRANDIEVT